MDRIPEALAPLGAYNQFIVWRSVPDPNGNKPRKVPYDPVQLRACDPHDHHNWLQADTAISLAATLGDDYDVGFVFTAADPFWFLDIDNCLVDGQWTATATDLLAQFTGAAVEVSYSGEGLHIFGSGVVPDHSSRNAAHHIEFYDRDRFVALSAGTSTATGDIATQHDAAINQLVATYFPPHGHSQSDSSWTTEPVSEWNGPEDDEVLINKALGSGSVRQAFAGGVTFADLWHGNADALGAKWPGDNDRPYDASHADASLAQHLAFWTGKDCERIERLMRRSALLREKWDRRERQPGYLRTTIVKMCAGCSSVYTAERKADPNDEQVAKRMVNIGVGSLEDWVKEAASALAEAYPPEVFHRAGSLVQICDNGMGPPSIRPLKTPSMRVILSKWAKWVKPGKDDLIGILPPREVVEGLLDSPNQWRDIPILECVSDVPILNAEGTKIACPGYDTDSNLYVSSQVPNVEIPPQLSREDAISAAKTLLQPFDQFPFEDFSSGSSVILSYLLTLAMRYRMRTAPLFCFSATTPGSGKTLLVNVCNLIVRGMDASLVPPLKGNSAEEEWRKRITSLLSAGKTSVNLDNCSARINSDSLNALLTSGTWSDRVLGKSETVTLPSNVTWAATGNNLKPEGDLIRRVVRCPLDPETEHPERRRFKIPNLQQHALRERPGLLTALFTIIAAYRQVGQSHGGDQLGSFEEWDHEVRRCVTWLEYPDPVESQRPLQSWDPDSANLGEVLRLTRIIFQDDQFSIADLADAQFNVPDTELKDERKMLRTALLEVASIPNRPHEIDRPRLGRWLASKGGRTVGGLVLSRIERHGNTNASARYVVSEASTSRQDGQPASCG